MTKIIQPRLPLKAKRGQYICLSGYAGSGKDVLAQHFLDFGYIRVNFGDLIKNFFNTFTQHGITPEELADNIRRFAPDVSEQDLAYFIDHYAKPYYEADHRIDAFTEDRELKPHLRSILEWGGELIYTPLIDEYERVIRKHLAEGKRVINTRTCLPNNKVQLPRNEAIVSRELGAFVVEVLRNDWRPETAWELDSVANLIDGDFVHRTVYNDSQSGEDWAEDSYFPIRDLILDQHLNRIFPKEPTNVKDHDHPELNAS